MKFVFGEETMFEFGDDFEKGAQFATFGIWNYWGKEHKNIFFNRRVLDKLKTFNWHLDGKNDRIVREKNEFSKRSESLITWIFGKLGLSGFWSEDHNQFFSIKCFIKSWRLPIATLMKETKLILTENYDYRNRDDSKLMAHFETLGLSGFRWENQTQKFSNRIVFSKLTVVHWHLDRRRFQACSYWNNRHWTSGIINRKGNF